MKGIGVFLSFLILISFLSFGLSQEEDSTKTNIDLNKTKEGIENVLGKIPLSEGNSSDFFETKANLPAGLEFFFKNLLGVKDSEITWGTLVVYLALWIILFMIVLNIAEFTPFDKTWTKLLLSLGLMVLLSVMGAIWAIADWITTGWKGVLIALGFLVLLNLVLSFIARRIKPKIEEAKAKAKGTLTGAAIEGLSQNAEAVAKAVEESN